MIPVKQTTRGGADSPPEERGDCFSAVLASLLELDLSEVPRFCELDTDWGPEIAKWLKGFGLAFVELVYSDITHEIRAELGFHVVSGISPRGLRHCVIAYGQDLVFDPHPDVPDRQPLLLPHEEGGEWTVGIFVPNDPANWS